MMKEKRIVYPKLRVEQRGGVSIAFLQIGEEAIGALVYRG